VGFFEGREVYPRGQTRSESVLMNALEVALSSSTPPTSRAAYTVDEFCTAHRISRSKLYELWVRGKGPRYIQIDTKKIISIEAASDWRRDLEAVA
jgi:hypothetical protein